MKTWRSLSAAKKVSIVVVATLLVVSSFGAVAYNFAARSVPASEIKQLQAKEVELTGEPQATMGEAHTSTNEPTKPQTPTSAVPNQAVSAPITPYQAIPQTLPTPDRSQIIAACEALKQSQAELYSANVASENSKHQTLISNTRSEYQQRGLGHSGLLQQALNNEDQRWQSVLAQIEVKHQQVMAKQCI